MLRWIYIVSLFAITFVAGAGWVYCGWLILSGDQNGLINLGKCLVLFLYGGYRLRSILTGHYMIYRPWENALTIGIKRAAHSLLVLGMVLFVIAVIAVSSLARTDYLVWVEMSLAMVLFSLFALEITNAFNSYRSAKS